MSTQKKTSAHSSSGKMASDAIAILKADHKQVKHWFDQFEKTKSSARKSSLATNICNALMVHMEVEEKLFYPAFLKMAKDKDIHHEAVVEHDCAKKLIRRIKSSGPSDDYYDSEVHVLAEQIKHHVKEEEQPGGMFAEARKSPMDLQALGIKIVARKKELMKRHKI